MEITRNTWHYQLEIILALMIVRFYVSSKRVSSCSCANKTEKDVNVEWGRIGRLRHFAATVLAKESQSKHAGDAWEECWSEIIVSRGHWHWDLHFSVFEYEKLAIFRHKRPKEALRFWISQRICERTFHYGNPPNWLFVSNCFAKEPRCR